MNAPLFQAIREMTREHTLSLRIRGACMTPTLDDGTTVAVRARRFYFPGDVLVFRTNAGELAAHRMLGWRRAAVVTKGDGCEIHDAPVASHSIIGAVDVPVRVRDRAKALLQFGGIVLRRLAR
jgi:Peptidase S24-like